MQLFVTPGTAIHALLTATEQPHMAAGLNMGDSGMGASSMEASIYRYRRLIFSFGRPSTRESNIVITLSPAFFPRVGPFSSPLAATYSCEPEQYRLPRAAYATISH